MPGIEGAEITICEALDTQLKRAIENDDFFRLILFIIRLFFSFCTGFPLYCIKFINIETELTSRQPEYREVTINHLSNQLRYRQLY